jgi:hypothetical protein
MASRFIGRIGVSCHTEDGGSAALGEAFGHAPQEQVFLGHVDDGRGRDHAASFMLWRMAWPIISGI